MRDVIIIGSGPAGYTAALYTARANLKPLMFEGEPQGTVLPGGQLMLTSEVENYPGFEHGVKGPDLMKVMRAQAERFGAEVVGRLVDAVEFRAGGPHRVRAGGEWHEARAVIIATGASPRLLDLPEMKPTTEGGLMGGAGISTCATCDGFFFTGKAIAVVGGGDSAMEEANFLTRYATSVTVIHRRAELRASKIMGDRARQNPKIHWALGTVVAGVRTGPNGRLSGVTLREAENGAERTLDVQGLFVAIGHDPNTRLFRSLLDMDGEGYLLHRRHTMTSVAGVFAAGDCVDHRYRQAVTAAGQGCQAAIDAERWLEEQGR